MQQLASPSLNSSSTRNLFLSEVPTTPLLTIHRRSETHHGRTLQILGHAAEYLASSHFAYMDSAEAASNREAINILMRLSREIFHEYAEIHRYRYSITDWAMKQVVRAYGAA